jgi:CRISPR-associated endonuclease Cas3-HD
VEKPKSDPIYGEWPALCLTWLQGLSETERAFPLPKPNTDLSPFTERIITFTDGDTFTEGDIDLLTITNPDKQFDIEPHIKGVKEHDFDIHVVWRDWLTSSSFDRRWEATKETLQKTGIKPAEVVRTSLFALWYEKVPVADCPSEVEGKKENTESRLYNKKCIIRRWGKYRSGYIKDVRPGDMVIIPSSYGGLDKWGWNLDSEEAVKDIYNDIRSGKIYLHGESEDVTIDDIDDKLKLLRRNKDKLSNIIIPVPYGVVVRPKGIYDMPSHKNISSLKVHTLLVMYYARKFLEALGLNSFLKEFAEAGHFHDLGKADWRFQERMYGKTLANPNHLMAKPVGLAGPPIKPLGWRHEMASLQILCDNNRQVSDLVQHLIGSHHGWWRPWPRVLVDDAHRPKNFELLGDKWISKNPFTCDILSLATAWSSLNKRYGPWGLAFLEAIFRLADASASCHKGPPPTNLEGEIR